jgi:hypothetical protein
MAKTTKIVIGRVGDALSSADIAVTDEVFTSVFDTAVKLKHLNFQAASVSVTNIAKDATYVEDTDYIIDYSNGTITVVSEEDMADATAYYINYTYNEPNLTWKINQITTGATHVYAVSTVRAGQNGVTTVIYD